MSNYQLYQEVLTSAAQGTPLWEPSTSPSQLSPSIGDVGYLRFGAFIRLFNATLPPGHVDNENGEPENYVPLNLRSTVVRSSVLPNGIIAASGVQTTGLSHSETDTRIHFKCTDKAGAVVMTDSDVRRQDTVNLEPFADYIATHAHEWAQFARFQLMHEVAMHELILLTGCDLTSGQYSVTAFNSARCSRRTGHGASFQLSYPSSKSHAWSHSPSVGSFEHNYGPGRIARPVEQCLFIRGFKILDRHVEKLEREDEAEGWFVENCCAAQPRGPLDAVLRYLSDTSDADIAVAHDNDLTRILEKDNVSCDYRSTHKRLRKLRRPVIVRSNVASLT